MESSAQAFKEFLPKKACEDFIPVWDCSLWRAMQSEYGV